MGTLSRPADALRDGKNTASNMTMSTPTASTPNAPIDLTASAADRGDSHVRREMAKGTGWMVVARLAVQGIGFLSVVVLARLLSPADFGLVALATTFSLGLQTISEFSFDVVLIQNRQAGRAEYDTAWTLSLCRNVALGIFLAVLAKQAASAFGDARLESVIYWLALSTVIEGFQNIGIVDFRKDMAFHKELVFTILGKVGSFVVTVPLAFLWRDYWPLVAGIVAGTCLRLVLSYVMHPYRPGFALTRWRELMHFSKWLVLNNICSFVFSRSDTFALGKLVGAEAVGVYGIAFEIANMTTANLIAPLRRATFPGYAKLSHDLDRLSTGFMDVLRLTILIGAPLSVGIGVVADPLVHVMLGAQWVGSIPLIQVLSIYGFLNLVMVGSGPIFLAMGRPKYVLLIMIGSTAVMLPSLVVGARLAGTSGIAWAVTLASAVQATTDFVLIKRLLRLSVSQVLSAGYRPLISSLVMAMAILELQAIWPTPVNALGWSSLLAASVVLGAIVYPAFAFLLWLVSGRPAGAETHVEAVIKGVLSTVFKRRSLV